MKDNILQAALGGRDTFGAYISIPNPIMVEICKFVGFDYIRLDLEHALISEAEVRECLRTAHALELPTWVRVTNLSRVTPLLDMGATGIILPDIKSKEEVESAVDIVKYAPIGTRGMLPSSRPLRYGLDPIAPSIDVANNEICLVVQLESQEALDNIDDILSVRGLDMVSVGKQDMSQSLGVAGQGDHPKVVAAENLQIQKTIAAGKCPAPLVTGLRRMKELRGMGVHCFTITYDAILLLNAFSNVLKDYKDCR